MSDSGSSWSSASQSEAGVDELIETGLIGECEDGKAAFRHALAREALYRDVPWLRRRTLHRELAEGLEGLSATGSRSRITGWAPATRSAPGSS